MLQFSAAVLKVQFHCLRRHVKVRFLNHHQKNSAPVPVQLTSAQKRESVDHLSDARVRTELNVPEASEFLSHPRDLQLPAGSMDSALLGSSRGLQLPAGSMGSALLVLSGDLQLPAGSMGSALPFFSMDSALLVLSMGLQLPADSMDSVLLVLSGDLQFLIVPRGSEFLNDSGNLCMETHPEFLFFSICLFPDHFFLFVGKIPSTASLYCPGALPVCHRPVPQVPEESEYFPVLYVSFPQKIFFSTSGFCVLLASL